MAENENKSKNKFIANDILNMIVGSTYARHASLDSEEYLKEIGFADSGKTEPEAIRIASMNLIIELTKTLLLIKDTVNDSNQVLKIFCAEEKEEVKE